MSLYNTYNWQSNDFFTKVALTANKIPGHGRIRKFGAVDGIALSTPTDIWGFGGTVALYVWPTTASIDTLSSSAVADTQDVDILGLDANWDEVSQMPTLDGRNKVPLTTPLIRVNRIENASNPGVDFAGDIYLYEDGAITAGVPDVDSTVKGFVAIGDNQTLQALYSVPTGFTAEILQYGTTLLGQNANNITTIEAYARLFGGTFNLKDRYVLTMTGTSARDEFFPVPGVFPEKTDFLVRMNSNANNSGATANAHILLIKTSLLA